MDPKRKICVVTGTRAEYGLLYWLMKEIKDDPELELQIIATGMHLSPEFGMTYKLIESDGFEINHKVEMLLSSDTPVGIAKSIGLGIIGFADALANLKPDIMVVLGDRYEAFAAAQGAMVQKIPIAHIHGGETTEGAIDEVMRHSITKMAQIHFVAAEPYRQRVIQLGEHPERVFNYGALGLDNLSRLKLLNKSELEKAINFNLQGISFLVTYHPSTYSNAAVEWSINELLIALDSFPQASIIFTKANSDAGGRIINQSLEDYAAKNPERIRVYTNLGQLLYLSTLNNVDLVIGNSSSGIYEAAYFKIPTVNIGDRQKGRLRGETVIDTPEDTDSILKGINQGLSKEFKGKAAKSSYLFGEGNGSIRIKETLKFIDLNEILQKKFYDIEVGL